MSVTEAASDELISCIELLLQAQLEVELPTEIYYINYEFVSNQTDPTRQLSYLDYGIVELAGDAIMHMHSS